MPTAKKREKVKELQSLLSQSQVLVFTDYRGMSVAEITNLRRQLREKGVEYHVTKNTLTELAANRANLGSVPSLLDGPTAIAFIGDDIPGGTKALTDYIRTSRTVMSIRGGIMGNQVLNPDQVGDLTKMLTREQYIAQVLGTMKAPMNNLVNVLSGTIRGVMNVLNAHIEKLKEAGDTTMAADGAAPASDDGQQTTDNAAPAAAEVPEVPEAAEAAEATDAASDDTEAAAEPA